MILTFEGPGSSGGAVIGQPITGGTPDEILYVDASGNLAQDAGLKYDGNNRVTIGDNAGADPSILFNKTVDGILTWDDSVGAAAARKNTLKLTSSSDYPSFIAGALSAEMEGFFNAFQLVGGSAFGAGAPYAAGIFESTTNNGVGGILALAMNNGSEPTSGNIIGVIVSCGNYGGTMSFDGLITFSSTENWNSGATSKGTKLSLSYIPNASEDTVTAMFLGDGRSMTVNPEQVASGGVRVYAPGTGGTFNFDDGVAVVDPATGFGSIQSASTIDGVAVDVNGAYSSFNTLWLNFYSPYDLSLCNGGGRVLMGISGGWMNSYSAVSLLAGNALDVVDSASPGSELVVNGGFSADTNWTKGTGWTISGGTANHLSNGTGTLQPAVSLAPTVGATYQVSFTITSITTPTIGIRFTFGGVSINGFGEGFKEVGTYTFNIKASSNANLVFTPLGTGARFSIDNVSVKLLPYGNVKAKDVTASGNVTGANLLSGTYTPTRSAETNLDANVTMFQAQYSRVGKVVTVSGRFTADPTLTATATSFEMSLPIASNIGAVEDLAGVAFCGAIAGQGAQISGSVANDTAVVSWLAGDVTSKSWSFIFSYEII